jgi:hypothetical protein
MTPDSTPTPAARQIQVVHQGVARIAVVPVALVVHARALIALTRSVVARIIPSGVGHSSLLASMLLAGSSVKTPRQGLRGVIQGSAEAPGRIAAAFRRVVCANLARRRSGERAVPACISTCDGPAADQEAA